MRVVRPGHTGYRSLGLIRIAAILLAAAGLAGGAELRAGAARIDITPDGPIWLSGYASRTHASTGVLGKLYAKALAVADSHQQRVVFVTADLVGLPRSLADEVSARAIQSFHLERSEILFNASHTHTGPVVWGNLGTMFDLPPGEVTKLKQYNRRLAGALETVIGAALAGMAPARLAFGEGRAGFARNRRVIGPDGTVSFGVNPGGPVDHSVPVLRVTNEKGGLVAVLFGYACHNTTLTGQHYEISGDYAGFAETRLEARHPAAVALFLQLCGADQNPAPRGEIVDARAHARELAGEVERVMNATVTPVRGPIRTALQFTELRFRPHTRKQFEAELNDDNPAVVRRARAMLEDYDRRRPIRSLPYPVQAVRIGNGFRLLALGDEVVVDYALRAKREYPDEPLVVAGYSNEVSCYVPSRRVLLEGGYETDRSMVYYGLPGPFAEDVETRIFETVRKVMTRIGVNPPGTRPGG